MHWQSLHSTNREMEFGKWLEYCIKTICGVFQIDPIEIGFDITKQGSGQTGAGGGGLGNGNQAERLVHSQDKGLKPLLRHLQGLINDYIVYRIDPNYELEFVGLNGTNEKDDLDKAIQQVGKFKTVNEIRAEHDLPPLKIDGKGEKLNLGDVIMDSSWIQLLTGQQQAAQQEQMGGEDGMMQPWGMTPGDDGQGAPGDGGGEEPDYDSMSLEELQAQLQGIQSGEQPEQEPEPKMPKEGIQQKGKSSKDGMVEAPKNGKKTSMSAPQSMTKSGVFGEILL
jgi:hypothetical protein